MSDKLERSLQRIEKALGGIAERQEALCDELAVLGERIDRVAERGGPVSRGELLQFLDQYRAAEALGEDSFGAWIAVSTNDCLRGGLRTIQRREGMHARLLEERLKELGGSVRYEVPEREYQSAMKEAGDPSTSDAEKVLALLGRYPEIDEILRPIYAIAERLDADPETQSMLRTLAQDERASFEFLREACALLNASEARSEP